MSMYRENKLETYEIPLSKKSSETCKTPAIYCKMATSGDTPVLLTAYNKQPVGIRVSESSNIWKNKMRRLTTTVRSSSWWTKNAGRL